MAGSAWSWVRDEALDLRLEKAYLSGYTGCRKVGAPAFS